MWLSRPTVHRIRNWFVYRLNYKIVLSLLLLVTVSLVVLSTVDLSQSAALIGRQARSVDPYEAVKPLMVPVTKASQSYLVDPTPTCWSMDCDRPNNYHAKKPCDNELATKWNLLGVESMERFLEGDRKSDTATPEEDYGYQYLQQAVDYFVSAVASDPTCARAHINLALAYMEQGKAQSAIHHATTAIKNDLEARYYAIRSFLYETIGFHNERIYDMEVALKLDKYIGERRYFGILLCNTTEIHRYVRWPLVTQYNPVAELIAARKVLLFIEFSKISISDYAFLQPGAADFFVDNKYIVLRKIVPPFVLREIQTCYRNGIKNGRIGFMDDQAMRYVAQNDRCGRLLLFNLVDLVRRTIAHNARPSYSYFGGYVNGSILNPHSDRPQCEYTFSITLQQNPSDKPWGLGMYRVPQFEKNDGWPGRDKEPWPKEEDQIWADLYEGDGLLFMGRHMIHFRKGMLLGEHRWLNQVFLHFVQDQFKGILD